MIRITALHAEPQDRDEFDRHYRFVHTPLVQRIPGVRNYQFGRVLETVDGEPAPYYVVSDLYFDDREALDNALESPEMQAAMADVPNFAAGGVTIMFCEYENFPPTPTDAN